MEIKLQNSSELQSYPVSYGSDVLVQRSGHSMSLRQSALVDVTSKGCMDISLEVNLCTSLRL